QRPRHASPERAGYIDSWEQDDALYIQTELCEFGNFAHFLWLDEARVWKIIADLSNGLHFIHDSGVIHLDLKPANIFIRLRVALIGDFGMAVTSPTGGLEASLRAARTAFEREGVLQGQYGKAADMFRCDLFQFLWNHMLETASNIVVPGEGDPWHRLRHDDLSPADLPTDTSPELRALIAALLCANPAARIDSAAVCAHPVVVRTRAAMERLLEEALRAGERPFAASPLAGVPAGFLEEVLSHSREPTAVVTPGHLRASSSEGFVAIFVAGVPRASPAHTTGLRSPKSPPPLSPPSVVLTDGWFSCCVPETHKDKWRECVRLQYITLPFSFCFIDFTLID
ncbi:kinase-like domain-containing protein, partial [Lactarius sanguifluus]